LFKLFVHFGLGHAVLFVEVEKDLSVFYCLLGLFEAVCPNFEGLDMLKYLFGLPGFIPESGRKRFFLLFIYFFIPLIDVKDASSGK